jgi:hypothetical protein
MSEHTVREQLFVMVAICTYIHIFYMESFQTVAHLLINVRYLLNQFNIICSIIALAKCHESEKQFFFFCCCFVLYQGFVVMHLRVTRNLLPHSHKGGSFQ